MLLRTVLALAVISFNVHTIHAALLTDFENLSDGTAVTNQILGAAFSNATVLTAGIGLNEFQFPPHSGTNVATDSGGPMGIVFTMPITDFEGYFTYTTSLLISAFDMNGATVATVHSQFANNTSCGAGPPCDGDPLSSPNELIRVTSVVGFTAVSISGSPGGDSFTADDLSVSKSPPTIPEPATYASTAVVIVALWICRRRSCRNARF